MLNNNDLKFKLEKIFNEPYEKEYSATIPNSDDILLHSNHGMRVDLATLFVDLRDSTGMVRALTPADAARMYKSFLLGVSSVGKDNKGEVLSFNGDGVLIGFSGNNKEERAVIAGLQMSHFLHEALGPKMKNCFDTAKHQDFHFGVGITTGFVLVIRGGIPGEENNDRVWVGDSVNTAVKISNYSKNSIQTGDHVFISEEVFNELPEFLKNKNQKSGVHTGLLFRGRAFWTKALPPPDGIARLFARQDQVYTTKYYIEPGTKEVIERDDSLTKSVKGILGLGSR